jgi:hypothetical protein
MSLTIPTAAQYKATLEQLRGEHARRVMAELELARLCDKHARTRDKVTWTHAMRDAALILHRIPADPPEVVAARRHHLEDTP